jgi:RNase P subunit RPR2
MPFLLVKCKNPNCEAMLVTPYYTSFMKQEEIRSSRTRYGPIQITCHECGHIDTYFRDDFRITAETNDFFSDHPRNRLKWS